MKVLFVCRSNTGRSQMAAAIFNQLTSNAHHANSAGTKVPNPEQKVGERPNMQNILSSMSELSLSIGDNSRKELNPQMLAAADKVIVMAEPETLPAYLKESAKVIFWPVTDPKDLPYEKVLEIRKEIQNRVLDLVKELSS